MSFEGKHATASEEETIALGREFARSLADGAVILLIGNLGAGKTTLAKGIVSGLGAAPIEEVVSPTFTLIHEYGAGVYHIDLYRLDEAREVETLGLDEIFAQARCVLIEWGERFPGLMPLPRWEIRLTRTGDEDREITVSRLGSAP